jgi:hypothetical protein
MTDDEKHEWCRQRGGHYAIILPPALYEAAERCGFDMRWYVRSELIETKGGSQ